MLSFLKAVLVKGLQRPSVRTRTPLHLQRSQQFKAFTQSEKKGNQSTFLWEKMQICHIKTSKNCGPHNINNIKNHISSWTFLVQFGGLRAWKQQKHRAIFKRLLLSLFHYKMTTRENVSLSFSIFPFSIVIKRLLHSIKCPFNICETGKKKKNPTKKPHKTSIPFAKSIKLT